MTTSVDYQQLIMRPTTKRERVHVQPPVVHKESALSGVVDALGGHEKKPYGEKLIAHLLEWRSPLDTVYIGGMPGEGKSTFVFDLATGLQTKAVEIGISIHVVHIDFADAVAQVKKSSHKPSVSQWGSKEWEEAASIFNNTVRHAHAEWRNQAGRGKFYDKVFFLIEGGITNQMWHGVHRDQGGGSVMERLVSRDNTHGPEEQKTMVVAVASGSTQIPENAGKSRALSQLALEDEFLLSDKDLSAVVREEVGVTVVSPDNDPKAARRVLRGAPAPVLEEMREELDDVAVLYEEKYPSEFSAMLGRISNPPANAKDSIIDKLQMKRRAAAYAMILHNLGILSEWNTVVYNTPRRSLRVRLPE